ncbi:DoxX family protein [Rhodoplanes sp. Z2-YC6860]|uniref:DoxX family protein n=1 Tax=Rhodoplanes sp. Z2-YC6860 TaxID=674703 RepID=UPI00078D175E|nr:DoxX family protein [Rhodoplanes sp. Z2-YC6860]AMN41495.1 DoxX family protein [Rhodoplanes sp. Z2-YC6860]
MLRSLTPLDEPTITGLILRFLLCSAYVWSGVTKLVAFNATVKHFSNRFQLPAPHAAVALTILVQLAGSAMFITGWMAAAAATLLAVFTMAATVIVYPFWKMSGVERARNIETFLEHVGLAAAFLILAWPLAR